MADLMHGLTSKSEHSALEPPRTAPLHIHKLVVKLHVIRTKENNDRYFERYFATRVIMDIILPPW